ncbi:MAG TPA: hypothetical protein VKT70_09530 [Stellaceae bacterium]|nr:hypothetical protein [Stellaceae bacterium]
MRAISMFVGAFLALAMVPALAQEAQQGTPVHVRGKIVKLTGQSLVVKPKSGDAVTVTLDPKANILGVTKTTLSKVKNGDFIGTAAGPGKDGKLYAKELVLFPEFARGFAEGHYDWDLGPTGNSMTNATVAEVTGKGKGRVLKLTYKGGENEIIIPAKAPIVTFGAGNKTLLKKGASVFIPANKMADGTIVSNTVLVGKHGVVPPM